MLADGLYVMVSVTVCMRKVAAGCWWHSDTVYRALPCGFYDRGPASQSVSLPTMHYRTDHCRRGANLAPPCGRGTRHWRTRRSRRHLGPLSAPRVCSAPNLSWACRAGSGLRGVVAEGDRSCAGVVACGSQIAVHAVVSCGVAEAVVPHASVEEEDVAGLERDDANGWPHRTPPEGRDRWSGGGAPAARGASRARARSTWPRARPRQRPRGRSPRRPQPAPPRRTPAHHRSHAAPDRRRLRRPSMDRGAQPRRRANPKAGLSPAGQS